MAFDIPVEDLLELGYYGVAVEGLVELAVDIHRGFGFFERAGETYTQVGVLGFAGAVDYAAHYCQLSVLDAGVLLAPLGHGGAEVTLYLLG